MVYRYDHPIGLGEQILRVRPLEGDAVQTAEYSVSIEPEDHSLSWQRDDYGNTVARVSIPRKVSLFSVRVRLVADVQDADRSVPTASQALGPLPFTYPEVMRAKLSPYLATSPPTEELERYIAAANQPGVSVLEFAQSLNRKIAKDVYYTERLEQGVQSPTETLNLQSGACRDTAWLLVQMLRQAGIAARFVSGYLVALAEPFSAVNDDTLSFHAWCDFYLPGTGWISLDPTSGRPATFMHIPLAAAPSPEMVAPLEGMTDPAEVELSFSMQARRIVVRTGPP